MSYQANEHPSLTVGTFLISHSIHKAHLIRDLGPKIALGLRFTAFLRFKPLLCIQGADKLRFVVDVV